MSPAENGAVDGSELRQRLPQQPNTPQKATSVDVARQTVLDLNTAESKSKKDDSEKRTYGRTPDGTVFTVPQTHDMVSQLLSPTQPKNLSDAVVITVLTAHIVSLYLLPKSLRIPAFAVIYLFWRACYNGGIGYLLHQQSNYNSLVNRAKKSKIFENPANGTNPNPALYKILKREMEAKIPKDYKFEDAPIEYNTWLTFRRVVDLVLMCDFTSYCLFAVACAGRPLNESLATTVGRWVAGIMLILFNLWVKLDAHRVVKDYAWYWGDFFYLIDQELTFDGVFEMAPHPMYSVGYAGYYGISLLAGSYKVLFISIIAHAAQFAFLAMVENPHIDKTYNPPPPRPRGPDPSAIDYADISDSRDLPHPENYSPVLTPIVTSFNEAPATKDILGIENIDLHRVLDLSVILIQIYFYTLAVATPNTAFYQFLFVVNAVAWRLWYSIGIGFLLDRQSRKKKWTRHFIKYGETTEEAWRQWKGVYHISMTMCYVSFITAAFKMYSLPDDWQYGMVTLRHVIGAALIALQLWTVLSIYESLGEFGWFFGDFFFDKSPQLTYSGIYRFLNNPERFLGLAGIWGFAIITWSKAIFFLALLSHLLTLCFIHFVERPHMEKRYGQSIRQDSGVSKTFRRSLPTPLKSWHGSVDRVLEDTADFVDDFIESTKPKVAAGIDNFVRDTKALFHRYPARVNITRVASGSDLAGYNLKDYTLEFEGTVVTSSSSNPVVDDKASGREGEMARTPAFEDIEFRPIALTYGSPIKVKWTAPLHHSKKDWVGLYMLGDNVSKGVTRIGTQGRWIATTKGVYDSRADQGILISDKQTIQWKGEQGQPMMTGEMEFSGDKLWWTTGVFEFRYHHDGKHNVMTTSSPFEILIPRFDEDSAPGLKSAGSELDLARKGSIDGSKDLSGPSLRMAIEQILLPLVRNCFDRDPEIAPNTVDEAFGALVEREGKFARRVVFALRDMFGIDLAPAVVKADGNVRNLAWRVCNARIVLAPYSMSSSAPHRASTPTDDK